VVYAIELAVTFRNANRRDAAQSLVETRLGQLSRWGITEVTVSGKDVNSLYLVARFANEADRDAFYAELDTRLGGGVNGPITGSVARWHNCSHDSDPPVPCVVGGERGW